MKSQRPTDDRTSKLQQMRKYSQKMSFDAFCHQWWRADPAGARRAGLADPRRREELRLAWGYVKGLDDADLRDVAVYAGVLPDTPKGDVK